MQRPAAVIQGKIGFEIIVYGKHAHAFGVLIEYGGEPADGRFIRLISHIGKHEARIPCVNEVIMAHAAFVNSTAIGLAFHVRSAEAGIEF